MSDNNVVITTQQVERQVVSVGMQGPPGSSSIGGFGVSIDNLQIDDVLMFGGTAWNNKEKNYLTDGGNF